MPFLNKAKVDTQSPEWNERLKTIVDKCVKAGPVERILVFGSFAVNDMTDASDLDLAVILPNDVDPNQFREKLERPLSDWPLDLLIVTSQRFSERKLLGGVLFDVNVDGIELYPSWKLSSDSSKTKVR
jgi:predicted nucleotidyltransferase